MPAFQLTTEILKLSHAKSWDQAKLEWALEEVYEAEEAETCLCGHFPIMEVCIIQNRITKARTNVGNCCIKKFIGLPSDKIFQAVKRVRRDSERSLNAETIAHALKSGWINQWQHDFYFDIMRKRSLTEKQASKKSEVNNLILHRMTRHK